MGLVVVLKISLLSFFFLYFSLVFNIIGIQIFCGNCFLLIEESLMKVNYVFVVVIWYFVVFEMYFEYWYQKVGYEKVFFIVNNVCEKLSFMKEIVV